MLIFPLDCQYFFFSYLPQVDFVIQRITSSSAQQLEFDVWSKKLDYKGPNLIA
jgi:hypothetical protein